jgi:hypothetical protein
MRQEARNTERHTFSTSGIQLRHRQVAFVSAGNMLRDDLDNPAPEAVSESLKDHTTSKADPSLEGVVESQTLPGQPLSCENMHDARSLPGGEPRASENELGLIRSPLFFIDSIGDKTGNSTNQKKLHIRPPSPAQVDSSEDEVVFVGRNKSNALKLSIVEREYTPPHTQNPAPLECVTDDSNQAQGANYQPSRDLLDETEAIIEVTYPLQAGIGDLCVEDDSEIDITLSGKPGRIRRRDRRVRQRRREANDEELILADYIANIQDEQSSGDESSEASISTRFPSEANAVKFKNPIIQPHKQEVAEDIQRSYSWSSDDLDDLGNLSTSDEIPLEVGCIFSKRQRRAGIEYLVTGRNQSPDEARWILKEHLMTTGAGEKIMAFERKEASFSGLPMSSQDSDSTSAGYNLGERLGETSTGIEDLLFGGDQESLSDEQLARLLEKQDKFGLTADDWNLGQYSDSPDIENRNSGSRSKRFPKKKRGNKNDQFPSAEAFADALDQDPYHGFDVMDFDRPSLREKPKGKHRALYFGLSDSETEWDLQQAWENDRSKKKAKKRVREELRVQGLLSKQSKINTGMRSSGSTSTDDVKDKIKAFLLTSSERYASLFPLMSGAI